MIRLLLASLLLVTTLSAETSIKLEKGWQFIGFPSAITDIETFNKKSVDILWSYDASSQAWLGYSPDETTQNKINKRYKSLSQIDA